MSTFQICDVCHERGPTMTVLKCDFCGRDQHHVRALVNGPFGSDICDECIVDAARAVKERDAAMAEVSPS